MLIKLPQMILRETTSLTNEILHNRIKKELEQAKNVVIMGHIRPDGDAIGSLLGLAQALRERGQDSSNCFAGSC